MAKRRLRRDRGAIKPYISVIRSQRIILDSELARIYGVETRRLNEQVRRNINRFPEDFAFRLTRSEYGILMSQIATSSLGHGGRRKSAWVFTEYGAIMAANVLNSPRASRMSVFVVRAFVKMRETLMMNKTLAQKLAKLEKQLTGRLDNHEKAILHILGEIKKLMDAAILADNPGPKRIGFRVSGE